MMKLYQFPPIDNMPNLSPFCMKLESYLKAMEIPYQVIETFDPRKSPTGKIPFVEIDVHMIADSGLIISRLEAQSNSPMQAKLTTTEKATSLAFMRLMEEHLYWVILYSRWVDDVGVSVWADKIQQAMGLSKIAFKLIFSGVRKNIEKSLQAHGIGRHNKTDMYVLAQDDIKAIADFLGGRDFCFGNKPTLMDHCLYAFICSIICVDWDYPLKTFTLKCQNLIDHFDRMMVLYFPKFSLIRSSKEKRLEVNG
ncbi:glutathione S-transferase family protein [Thiotrichales bacterium 19S3-7]|nr:glutathione S-transferase family protein [Thiotrichales bacterium 19S3-7]MCF6802490.1 glutathione S-transferase family protein [Thiotrichales bacterium 19S3-11]